MALLELTGADGDVAGTGNSEFAFDLSAGNPNNWFYLFVRHFPAQFPPF